MNDHVLHVGVRVDHMADGGSLHCDGLVLLPVEGVGKIEKLHAGAAGDGGEEGEEVGGDHDSTLATQSIRLPDENPGQVAKERGDRHDQLHNDEKHERIQVDANPTDQHNSVQVDGKGRSLNS